MNQSLAFAGLFSKFLLSICSITYRPSSQLVSFFSSFIFICIFILLKTAAFIAILYTIFFKKQKFVRIVHNDLLTSNFFNPNNYFSTTLISLHTNIMLYHNSYFFHLMTNRVFYLSKSLDNQILFSLFW